MLSDSSTHHDNAPQRETLGLNQTLKHQYSTYFSSVQKDNYLGQSILRRQPAALVVSERIGATLILALAAFAISLAVGLPAGIISAVRRNTVLDRLAMIGQILKRHPGELNAEGILTHWPSDIAKPGERTVRTALEAGFEQGLWQRTGSGQPYDPFQYSAEP